MIPSVFRTTLPLAALLAGLPALPAAAQDHAGTMQGMSGMDMSGMEHGSMSMQGPMENMPGMQAAGQAPKPHPTLKPNAAARADCRAMPGMAMSGGGAPGGCGTQGSATVDQPMPEAVRER